MASAQADYASAELNQVEVGALKALASLGRATTADVAEFVAGFVGASGPNRDATTYGLMALDALGWCAPADNQNPTEATAWYLTSQGRVALASLAR